MFVKANVASTAVRAGFNYKFIDQPRNLSGFSDPMIVLWNTFHLSNTERIISYIKHFADVGSSVVDVCKTKSIARVYRRNDISDIVQKSQNEITDGGSNINLTLREN